MKIFIKSFRIFFILMTVILMVIGCSKTAPASEFNFEVIGNGIKITGYTGDGTGGKLVIPGKINGIPVTVIEDRVFKDNKTIVSVTIPDSVTEIEDGSWQGGTGAFYGSSISSVKLSKNLKKIGDCTFLSCLNLTSINIPNSVTQIGYRAFQNCKNLTSINIPNSVTEIGVWAFASCDSLNEESRRSIQATGYNFDY